MEWGRMYRRRTSLFGLVVVLLTVYHWGHDRELPGLLITTATETTSSSSTTSEPKDPVMMDMEVLLQRSKAKKLEEKKKVPMAPPPPKEAPASSQSQSSPASTSPDTASKPANTTTVTTPPLPPEQPPAPLPPPPPSFNFTITESDGCGDNWTVPEHVVPAQFSNFARRVALSELMEIMQAGSNPAKATAVEDGLKNVAMCKLRRSGNYAHFPHMMQQFTRCFSFWKIFGNTLYEPYLYMYTQRSGQGEVGFNQGMLNIFRRVFNVTVVYNLSAVDESTFLVKPLYDTGMKESLQQGIVFQNKEHAAVFREQVQQQYGIQPEGCRPRKTEPVIAILNRRAESHRTIVNVDRLQTYLQKLTSHPVTVVYFENKTFVEQITFMSQVDILISPHGAQLSSLPFISLCGGVFEIFPSGYYLPHFFGPLAVTSGLRHGFVYTGEDVQTEWYQGNLHDRPKRFRARDAHVCVPLSTSLEIIGKMVDKWKVCCQEMAREVGLG